MNELRGLWRGKREDNGEWYIGDYIRYPNGIAIAPYNFDRDKGIINVRLQERVDPSTLGEYVGRTDKNGKLAFEGDLIKDMFSNGIGVIKYGEYKQPFNDDKFTKHIGFYIDWLKERDKMTLRVDLGYWLSLVEIIGNIHDNPELLNAIDNTGITQNTSTSVM